MSKLPNMKYTGDMQRGQNIVFKGLNLSDTATEGELIACANLSARRFPYLSARVGRSKRGEYQNATAAFMWNGHEIVAENGKLLYDGAALCNCSAGAKQFAVVNTKLVVWPDKLVIDMTDKTFCKLDEEITNNGAVSLSADSISFVPRMIYSVFEHEAWGRNANDENGETVLYMPWMWSYENAEWDAETGVWKTEGGELRSMEKCDGRVYIPDVAYNEDTGGYIVSLPVTQFPKEYGGTVTEEELPEPKGNTQGFYCEISGQALRYQSGGAVSCQQKIYSYWSAQNNDYVMTDLFSAGDEVNISDSLYGLLDCAEITVASVDENKITFESGALRPIRYVYEVTEDMPNYNDGPYDTYYFAVVPGEIYMDINCDGLYKGDLIYIETDGIDFSIDASYAVYLRRAETGEEWKFGDNEYSEFYAGVYPVSGAPSEEVAEPMQKYDPGRLTVQRVAYDFDYICEKDNRLWGVCNRQKDSGDGARGRLIFASALGDPTEFDKFDGLSTDSWQAAIAGDGDFTACCNYGDCVLFFKEDKVYKVAGDLPEEYTLYPYNIAGVQQGSHKSLVNINETLFYKGVNGVYAYGGGVPSLVSSVLGRKKYYDACAGSDGIVYYISMRDEEGYHLFTYDTLTGVWLREDDTAAADFCFSGGELMMLKDGKLLLINGDAETDDGTLIEWSAELAPFNEASDHNRRSYSRLLLRTGASKIQRDSVNVYVSNISGRWDACVKHSLAMGEYIIPLKPNRDNDLRIKIVGQAPDMVLSLAREYIGGSELGGVK